MNASSSNCERPFLVHVASGRSCWRAVYTCSTQNVYPRRRGCRPQTLSAAGDAARPSIIRRARRQSCSWSLLRRRGHHRAGTDQTWRPWCQHRGVRTGRGRVGQRSSPVPSDVPGPPILHPIRLACFLTGEIPLLFLRYLPAEEPRSWPTLSSRVRGRTLAVRSPNPPGGPAELLPGHDRRPHDPPLRPACYVRAGRGSNHNRGFAGQSQPSTRRTSRGGHPHPGRPASRGGRRQYLGSLCAAQYYGQTLA